MKHKIGDVLRLTEESKSDILADCGELSEISQDRIAQHLNESGCAEIVGIEPLWKDEMGYVVKLGKHRFSGLLADESFVN